MAEIKPVINSISSSDRFNASNRQNNQDPFSITGDVVTVKTPPQGAQVADKNQMLQQQNQLYSELSKGVLKSTFDQTNVQSTQMRDLVAASKSLQFSTDNMSEGLKEKIFINPGELQQALMKQDQGSTAFQGEAFDILRLISKLNTNQTNAGQAAKALAQMASQAQGSGSMAGQAGAVQIAAQTGSAAQTAATDAGAAMAAQTGAAAGEAAAMAGLGDLAEGAVALEFSNLLNGDVTDELSLLMNKQSAAQVQAQNANMAEAEVVIMPQQAAAEETQQAAGFANALSQALNSNLVKTGDVNLQNSVVNILRHFDCYTSQDGSLEAINQQLEKLSGNVFKLDQAVVKEYASKIAAMIKESAGESDGKTNPYTQLQSEMAGKDILSADGDRMAANQRFLKNEMVPMLSKLVNKYNQSDSVRNPAMSIIHYVARYDKASPERLLSAVNNMGEALENIPTLTDTDIQELKNLILDSAREIRMEQKTESIEKDFLLRFGASAEDKDVVSFISQALDNDSPARVQKLALNLLHTMVDNESPAMPLEHFMIPINYNGSETYLEAYVDKDCEARKGSADKAVNIFFTIESEDYGTFEVDLLARDKMIDIDIKAPAELQREVRAAKGGLRDLIADSGYRLALYRVAAFSESTSAASHFKELRKQSTGLDVKI